jgi:DNA repair exonuclease SbcCD nuclease subunit
MKIIQLSDMHLISENPVGRIDNLVETQWEKFNYVFEYAAEHSIYHILQAGDLTDIKRSWILLQQLAQLLEFWRKRKIRMYCVKGQHDSYYHDMTNDKTILGVLITTGLVDRLSETPLAISPGINIYGTSYGEEIAKVVTTGINILVIHKQIITNKMWAMQEEYELASDFIKRNNAFDLILCGDAHQKFEVSQGKRIICNTGVMLRLESSDQMFKHSPGFYVYDTEKNKLEWVEIPHMKAKLVLSCEHLQKQKQRKHNFDLFINRVKDTNDDQKSVSFEKNLASIMKKNKTKEPVKKIVSNYLEGEDK